MKPLSYRALRREATSRAPSGRPAVCLAVMLCLLLAAARDSSASAYVTADRLWPQGVVPFRWDPAMPSGNRLRVVNAMNIWTDVAHVRFTLRTNETDYVLIQNAPGSEGSRSPSIGRKGGRQDLFIRQNLSGITDFGLAHELGHVLGFYHTHQRADRDNFIIWHKSRTIEAEWGNFTLQPDALGYPRNAMDFDSVMSYGRCTFAVCDDCGSDLNHCRVLEIKNPADAAQFDDQMGQRQRLTRIDGLVMSFLYPESGWRFVEGGYPNTTETGTFHQPYLTLAKSLSSAPNNATVWIQPGSYKSGQPPISKPTVFRAPLGGVLIRAK